MKLTALLLPGFIFFLFYIAHSPNVYRSVCNLMSLLSIIFRYIIQSLANNRGLDPLFFQISLTSARKSRGPNTFPCGTPEFTLSSDNCSSTLTLCELPKRNSFTHTSTLKSTPVAAIFVTSLSRGIKSNAFEKSIIIASVLTPSSSESAIY